jgi:protein involved in polysaccharide export with SLBB domain
MSPRPDSPNHARFAPHLLHLLPAPNKFKSPAPHIASLMKKTQFLAALFLIVFLAAGNRASFGQDGGTNGKPRITAEPAMGADDAVSAQVSLSAEKIISILGQEPGLLLRSKQLLVQKAYEQGRWLDPQDLTDESLFRLIADNSNIRALVTGELEDRGYVHVKPSRQEREEAARFVSESDQRQPATSFAENPSDDTQGADRSENAAQSRQDARPQPAPDLAPGSRAPSYNVPPSEFSNSPYTNPEWQLNRTDAADNSFDLPPDAQDKPRVLPQDLPVLLNINTSERDLRENNQRRTTATRPDQTGLDDDVRQPLSGGIDQPSSQRARPRVPQPQRSSVQQDQPQIHHRPNPYANVPSLYDLYSQYSRRTPSPERFGIEIFQNGTGNLDDLPMDVPVGPDYVLGPGDGLSINVWGGVSQRLQRSVDREGRVSLPEVGAVEVAGRSLDDVQHLVQSALRTEFRDVQADVSLARLRTVRVYVVGDVERPGAYDVSSLSTPLNALYTAHGPTQRGSLRNLQHYRGKQLVQELDVYDLLLHGIRSGMERLQPGDTILVPPLGPTVTLEGMVRRPAVYELRDEKSLSEVLELAGGALASGTLREIEVQRLVAHDHSTMLRIALPESDDTEAITKALDDFKVQPDDVIKIWPIVPYAEKTIYLDGHVLRPGKYAYQDGMRVSDVIASYKTLLPEPYERHAEIIRLNAPDYAPEVIAFNLKEALDGKDQDLKLQPFDTVRVFGRYDFEDPPTVTVTGEVREPGEHVSNGTSHLRDAIYLAGGATPDASLDDAQIYRRTEDGELKVISVNLGQALTGDAVNNLLLQPRDHVIVHRNVARVDPPRVTIQGEVPNPGKFLLGEGMRASDLVRLAGGLKRSADAQEADLTRYLVGDNAGGQHIPIPIVQAMAGEPDANLPLHEGDVLTIRQVAGWNDLGASITVSGEVLHPGTYGIQQGERLSSILARAGGFSPDAYPYGAIFERVQVQHLEERNHAQLIRDVQDEGASLKLVAETDEDQKTAKNAALLQWKSTLERLQSTPPDGRLVIHISADVKRWANSVADVPMRAGDTIFIPKKPNFVMVDGSVYHPTAVTFKPGKDAKWYLNQAGGPNNVANKKAIFVIRADGSVAGGSGGLFSDGALGTGLQAGDTVVVPEKAFSGSSKWKNTLQAAQLVSSVGIAIQVARAF